MKVNIIGNGSIGAKYMSASTLLDDHVLVDVPNGVTKHLKNLGYDVLAIDTILLTHLHGDHFFDLPFFLLNKLLEKNHTKITIVGPKETAQKVQQLVNFGFPNSWEKLKECFEIEMVKYDTDTIIQLPNLKIETKEVKHADFKPAFGYVVEIEGKKIAFSGDSCYCEAIEYLVQEAEVSILDMSMQESGNEAHMGYTEIQDICTRYPEKKIIATHMHERTIEKALANPIPNLIVPAINEKLEF